MFLYYGTPVAFIFLTDRFLSQLPLSVLISLINSPSHSPLLATWTGLLWNQTLGWPAGCVVCWLAPECLLWGMGWSGAPCSAGGGAGRGPVPAAAHWALSLRWWQITCCISAKLQAWLWPPKLPCTVARTVRSHCTTYQTCFPLNKYCKLKGNSSVFSNVLHN